MNGSTWQVTGQTPEQQFDASGNTTTGKLISFSVSPQGYQGTVFVPDSVYANVDDVRTLIQAEVDRVVAVHALTG